MLMTNMEQTYKQMYKNIEKYKYFKNLIYIHVFRRIDDEDNVIYRYIRVNIKWWMILFFLFILFVFMIFREKKA